MFMFVDRDYSCSFLLIIVGCHGYFRKFLPNHVFFNNALNDDFSECIAALTSILLSVSPESSTDTVCPSWVEFLAENFCDNGSSAKKCESVGIWYKNNGAYRSFLEN